MNNQHFSIEQLESRLETKWYCVYVPKWCSFWGIKYPCGVRRICVWLPF